MNFGTKIRTVARIAFSVYTASVIWQTVVDGFGNKTISMVWAILIIFCGWVVDAATTYYNNDFTEIADRYTADMRAEKARLRADDEEDAEEEIEEIAFEEGDE